MTIGMVIALVKAFAPGADPAVIEQAVADWLDAHPEATTTVQDGSITEAKLAEDVLADLAEIEELKEAIVPVEGFMEVNDLEGNPGDKYNVLKVPYDLSDMVDNAMIGNNGSILTGDTRKVYMVTPLIPVSKSGLYGLKTHTESGNYVGSIVSGKNGFCFYEQDGTTPIARSDSDIVNVSGNIYTLAVPNNTAYVRFTVYKVSENTQERTMTQFNQWIFLPDATAEIDDSFFILSTPKENGEIKRIKRTDGSYLEIVDEEARDNAEEALAMPITFGRRTCAIFEKVCCIGDSYTAGYIYNTNGAHTNNAYSWVKHLETLTGREYVNCGISGATTASWLTHENGLAKAQLPENKAQAYIIGLQINDVAEEMPVGTVSDIGTSAQTYYGYTSKIIDELFNINGSAHVFVLARPSNAGALVPYREAILNIVEWYQTTGNGTHQSQVHLIDLLDYVKMFQYAGCNDSAVNGHFTAVGYESVAEIMMYALSNYLNAHPLLFQDVNLIPFGTST